MKTIIGCLLAGLLAPARLVGGDGSLLGDWAGGFEQGDDYIFVRLHFKSKDGVISGTYDAPLLFQQGRSLKRVSLNASTVSFEIPNQPGTRFFKGEIKDGGLAGTMKEGPSERPFRFSHLTSIEPKNYLGTYEIERGHCVFIRAGVEIGLDGLQFIDFKTGRFGVLFPVSATNFFTGPTLLVPYPVEASVSFTLDAQVEATEFTWTGAQRWKARRVKLRQEDVTFTNGGVTISGTLVLPTTPPPYPVVVFAAGGSTAGTREMFRHLAEFFALDGIAGLIYDKRGLGGSSGDWLRTGFDDLAEDALAGVRLLKTRSDIDARHIGMMGASQSGWIVAMAAARSPEVAFIISQSGSGVGVEEQELYRSEAWLRADGFSEEDLREAMKFVRQRYRCAESGEGWDALAEAEREVSKKSWFSYVGGHAGEDNSFWGFWRLIHNFDPVPALENVRCPVLALWGAKDTFVPAEKSARIWQAALAKAGNEDVTIKVYPEGDHSLIISKNGGLKESARLRGFVPGYFETLRDWTQKHTR
jgi:pimeloyl-ACP methyl ester carboxylesterase